MKQLFIFLIFSILFFANTNAQYGATSCMGAQTVTMAFPAITNASDITGTANVVGSTYRYRNVLQGTGITQQVDAVFTLTAMQIPTSPYDFTKDFALNYDCAATIGGVDSNFQPGFVKKSSSGAANRSGGTANTVYNLYSDWTVNFYKANTTIPVFLPFTVIVIDNDGTLATNTDVIRESITFNTTPSSLITSPFGAIPSKETISGNTVTGPNESQLGVATSPEFSAFANYASASGFSFRFNNNWVVTNTNINTTVNNRQSSFSIGCQWPGSTTFAKVNLTGTVFNDVNGLTNSTVDGTGIGGPLSSTPIQQLYANLLSADGVTVLATIPVNSNGTYTLPVGKNSGYTVQISTNQGTVGSPAPATALPAGWAATGETGSGTGAGNDGTANLNTAVTVGVSDVANINFGIQQPPQSAVNSQVIGLNPGGTVNTTVNPNWFVTSNVGTNPNTQDSSGGTVDKIRITAFPSNATSITIGGVTYYPNAGDIPGTCPTATCAVWPAGGVTINAPGGVPSQTITVDPVNGVTNVVIPFVAIDNAGIEDPTPGSVTLQYTSILAIDYLNFSATKINAKTAINFEVAVKVTGTTFSIERSTNGAEYTSLVTYQATQLAYNFVDANPVANANNYYRIKQIDPQGKITYSNVKIIRYTANATVGVYPTPAKNNVNILLTDKFINKTITVEVFNSNGQQVLFTEIKNVPASHTLNVSKLNTGTYYVKISTATDIATTKIVIAN